MLSIFARRQIHFRSLRDFKRNRGLYLNGNASYLTNETYFSKRKIILIHFLSDMSAWW